jgi:hypothetical protein
LEDDSFGCIDMQTRHSEPSPGNLSFSINFALVPIPADGNGDIEYRE